MKSYSKFQNYLSLLMFKIGGVEPKEENVYNDKYLVLF